MDSFISDETALGYSSSSPEGDPMSVLKPCASNPRSSKPTEANVSQYAKRSRKKVITEMLVAYKVRDFDAVRILIDTTKTFVHDIDELIINLSSIWPHRKLFHHNFDMKILDTFCVQHLNKYYCSLGRKNASSINEQKADRETSSDHEF